MDEVIEIETMEQWHAFVRLNYQAILEAYGSVSAAYLQAGNGGLIFGGGAAPAFRVHLTHN